MCVGTENTPVEVPILLPNSMGWLVRRRLWLSSLLQVVVVGCARLSSVLSCALSLSPVDVVSFICIPSGGCYHTLYFIDWFALFRGLEAQETIQAC